MLEQVDSELELRWMRPVNRSSAGSEYASLHAMWFLAGGLGAKELVEMQWAETGSWYRRGRWRMRQQWQSQGMSHG
jgi:hypothetical protein